MTIPHIVNMIAAIRNAGSAALPNLTVPANKLCVAVANVLKKEGYINSYASSIADNGKNELKIELKYKNQGNKLNKFAIEEITLVSKPGRREYIPYEDIKRPYNGLGIYIISTSLGVLTDVEAKAKKVGGEVICKVF